jgi:hypothetical protein
MPDARRFDGDEASHMPEAAQFLLVSRSLPMEAICTILCIRSHNELQGGESPPHMIAGTNSIDDDCEFLLLHSMHPRRAKQSILRNAVVLRALWGKGSVDPVDFSDSVKRKRRKAG